MSEKLLTEGTLALGEQQQVIVINAAGKPQDIKLRVAAYARVSSSSDDQLNSFDAQNKHYSDLIRSKENWQMVDIYADCGLSGRSAAKRDDFQRLLSDCRNGKIDRILVKSISRFARNTKECLEIIRELKLLGISVYFEKKDLWTEGVVKMLKKNQINVIYQRKISSENNGISLIEAVFTAK